MSAELKKSKFVWLPLSVVCVAIISEPNARISFKFWLLLHLGHTLGLFWIFEKKKKIGGAFFTNIIHLTWDPMGEKKTECYSYKSQLNFFNFSWMFFPMVLTKLHLGFFFVFVNMRPYALWSKNFKTLLLQIPEKKVSNLAWIFLAMVPIKLLLEFLKFWVADF